MCGRWIVSDEIHDPRPPIEKHMAEAGRIRANAERERRTKAENAAHYQRMADESRQPARDAGALDAIAQLYRDFHAKPDPALSTGGIQHADEILRRRTFLLAAVEEIVRDSGRNLNPPEVAP